MSVFSSFGGNGNFTLRFNNRLVSILPFKGNDTDALSFDFDKIIKDPKNSDLFVNDSVLNVSLAVENFTLPTGKVDFRALFIASHWYVDTNKTKPVTGPSNTSSSTNMSMLNFEVALYNSHNLGRHTWNGATFVQNVTIENVRNLTGLLIAKITYPSCLELNVTSLASLYGMKEFYNFKELTKGEITFNFELSNTSERIMFSMEFEQKFSGYCSTRLHHAYQPYNQKVDEWRQTSLE